MSSGDLCCQISDFSKTSGENNNLQSSNFVKNSSCFSNKISSIPIPVKSEVDKNNFSSSPLMLWDLKYGIIADIPQNCKKTHKSSTVNFSIPSLSNFSLSCFNKSSSTSDSPAGYIILAVQSLGSSDWYLSIASDSSMISRVFSMDSINSCNFLCFSASSFFVSSTCLFTCSFLSLICCQVSVIERGINDSSRESWKA